MIDWLIDISWIPNALHALVHFLVYQVMPYKRL